MQVRFLLLIVLFFSFNLLELSAQEPTLLLNKPGIFKILDRGASPDNDCGFSKTEIAANYKKILTLSDAVQGNPVLMYPKGFDCNMSVTYWYCGQKQDCGITCELNFQFCWWYLDNGKEVRWNSEPPEWDLYINNLKSVSRLAFNVTSNQPVNAKPGFNMEQYERAADRVNELFYPPGAKETLGKGIDRYNAENLFIYNPERPPYWIHVTIREVFGLLSDYYRQDPDMVSSEMILKLLDKEYSQFSELERDGNAYLDTDFISKTSSDSSSLPLMRINPAYWNKNLPRSSIQLLYFRCPADKNQIRDEKEEQLKNNDGNYHVSRFVEALDYNIFIPLIDK